MHAKDIKKQLRLLIEEASVIDPGLARKLEDINRWVKDVKPGSLTAKKFVLFFLQQIIQDALIWLDIQALESPEEQDKYFARMTPSEYYWYKYLFPKWLNQPDPKFSIWKRKLMAGEFQQEDINILRAIATDVVHREGTFWHCYIADFSMATDIIISNKEQQPLCIQITSLSDEFSQEKSDNWENTLQQWGIDRGLFLSYNPHITDFVTQLVNISLYNSDRLKTGVYLKFSL